MIGSPKKLNPTIKVMTFMKRYDDKNNEIRNKGATTPANRYRCLLGKGIFGDKAL